jgi:hypothetical protein
MTCDVTWGEGAKRMGRQLGSISETSRSDWSETN